jgi:hypothetical protein
MQAIEFKTTIHNGIVTIPSQYSPAWEGKAIRIIVLEDIAQPIEPPQKIQFNAISLNTQGFKFNREEANAR